MESNRSREQILDEDDLPLGMSALSRGDMALDSPEADSPVYPKGERCKWCQNFLSTLNPIDVCHGCIAEEFTWQMELADIRAHSTERVNDRNARIASGSPVLHTLLAKAKSALKVQTREAVVRTEPKPRLFLNDVLPGETSPDEWAWPNLRR